jgi:uncharacterized protein with HEPN domain
MITERDYSWIEDMVAYARDAVQFMTGDVDLLEDKIRQYAVIRAVEVVGEAASRVSAETRAAYPDVPWREAIGMRNILIHAYAKIDLQTVAGVVRRDFPRLVETLERVLAETPEP